MFFMIEVLWCADIWKVKSHPFKGGPGASVKIAVIWNKYGSSLMKKCGFFAQFFESRDADAVYTCLQRSSTTFRHFKEKLSWCRTFKVGPAPKNGQLRRSKSRSPLTSGLTDWIGIVEWPFYFREIESNLSALPPIWRESRFCNTYIRVFPLKFPSWSDPQVWLSCHFNVDEKAPLSAFNHRSSMPIESYKPNIGPWKGAEGVGITLHVLLLSFL